LARHFLPFFIDAALCVDGVHLAKTMSSSPAPRLSRADIVGVCGDILDWKIEAIIDSGATLAELEVASAWVRGDDEVLGEEREPLAGTTAQVYDILITDEPSDEER
jgi:hypothetical protein